MAITKPVPTQEVTLIGVKEMAAKSNLHSSNCTENSNGHHRRSDSSTLSTCDESTCASLSSADTSSPITNVESQSKRRRGSRKKRTRRGGKNRGINALKEHEKRLEHLSQEVPLEEQVKYVALDSEMVGVGYRGRHSSIARVTLVGWNGEILFDEFVKQEQLVTDYRTFVSGITAEDMDSAQLTLVECRQTLKELLDGKILVGHGLKNDLKALGLSHSWQQTRDTAKYEPFQQVRFDDGVLWPRKLKDLAQEKLKREIQIQGHPHSAWEDAMAAMDLYKMARRKWEKVMDYKIKKTQEIIESEYV